jgi:hypothetical protein
MFNHRFFLKHSGLTTQLRNCCNIQNVYEGMSRLTCIGFRTCACASSNSSDNPLSLPSMPFHSVHALAHATPMDIIQLYCFQKTILLNFSLQIYQDIIKQTSFLKYSSSNEHDVDNRYAYGFSHFGPIGCFLSIKKAYEKFL